MQKYLDLLKEKGADLAVAIDVKTVKTAPWTVYRCRYGCDFYGKSHCCPPHSPTWKETQEMLDCFTVGILFRCQSMREITPFAREMSNMLFLDGYYKAMAFSSGPCRICEQCDPEHCRFPKLALPSMEACGIDVFATVRNNGIPINVIRAKNEQASYFGLILVE